ncbi:hypothetical protein [Zavarzinella formosa]|uniref:hypothetical protein n=1 Tax=Zavarzinella formosa TaxID=360055 RepID=UPI0002D670EA|nr:hypothetical protein [Zavarzinella formosa]
MCSAVSLDLSSIPKHIFDEHDLLSRVYDRGGNQPEIQFAITDPEPLLPVLDGGVFRLMRWGSRDRAGRLPTTGWTWRGSVEGGAWAKIGCPTEPVTILADYGCENRFWYKITKGIHGLIVRPEGEPPAVFMICEEPTRYYRVMTRGERMPWLIDEVI